MSLLEISPQTEGGSAPMCLAEIETLTQCERVIERGQQTFMEVGDALMTIRNQRLYRETHGSFESYVLARWNVSKAYANRMIAATELASELTPIGVILENENQARGLGRLSPQQRQEAVELARELKQGKDESVTAKEVLTAAQTLYPTEKAEGGSPQLQAFMQGAPQPLSVDEATMNGLMQSLSGTLLAQGNIATPMQIGEKWWVLLKLHRAGTAQARDDFGYAQRVTRVENFQGEAYPLATWQKRVAERFQQSEDYTGLVVHSVRGVGAWVMVNERMQVVCKSTPADEVTKGTPAEAETAQAAGQNYVALYGALDAPMEGRDAVTRIFANEQLRIIPWVGEEWHVHDVRDNAMIGYLLSTPQWGLMVWFEPAGIGKRSLGAAASFAEARYLLAAHLLAAQRLPRQSPPAEETGAEEVGQAAQKPEGEGFATEFRQGPIPPHSPSAGSLSGAAAEAFAAFATGQQSDADATPKVQTAEVEPLVDRNGREFSEEDRARYRARFGADTGEDTAAGNVNVTTWHAMSRDVMEAVAQMQAEMEDVCLDYGDVLAALKLGGFDNEEDDPFGGVDKTVEQFCDYWPPLLRGLLMYARDVLTQGLRVEGEDLALLAKLAARRSRGVEEPVSALTCLRDLIAQKAEQADVRLDTEE